MGSPHFFASRPKHPRGTDGQENVTFKHFRTARRYRTIFSPAAQKNGVDVWNRVVELLW
jgi:hypothetical protein